MCACLVQAPGAVAEPRVAALVFERELTGLERATQEARPAVRGFFPPLGNGIDPAGAWRSAAWLLPDPQVNPEGARAAELVARRLATDGVLATIAQVFELERGLARESRLARLVSAGVPLDWAACFTAPDGAPALDALARRIDAGASASELATELARWPFRFTPSVSGFEVATESGEHAIGTLRVQLTAGHHWQGPGDGGAVDVVRQLLASLPDTDVVAAIEARNVEEFRATARTWHVEHLQLLPQDLVVSQWAQDDAKSGFVADGSVVTLVPRYASRGEEASSWVPGDARALEAFAAAGFRVARSPLLFQGGNLIVVRDPKRAERVLLVGETEIFRNVALGLTHEQVVGAFQAEFGVARVLVLPALAYHVDYEVSVRAIDGELVCFVNDAWPAVQEILHAASRALAGAAKLDAQSARELDSAIDALDAERVAGLLGPQLVAQAVGPGQFRESFARIFSAGERDSHIANFQRVLLAVDLLLGRAAAGRAGDPNTRAYLEAGVRQMQARTQLAELLSAQGWSVVPVPSFSEGARSIDYLNGVHAQGLYLMPAWGGLFAALDARAQAAFERRLGPGVRVVPIFCSESQRRFGAVRCAVGVLPRRGS